MEKLKVWARNQASMFFVVGLIAGFLLGLLWRY